MKFKFRKEKNLNEFVSKHLRNKVPFVILPKEVNEYNRDEHFVVSIDNAYLDDLDEIIVDMFYNNLKGE